MGSGNFQSGVSSDVMPVRNKHIGSISPFIQSMHRFLILSTLEVPNVTAMLAMPVVPGVCSNRTGILLSYCHVGTTV